MKTVRSPYQEAHSAGTLISDFQPPEVRENKFLLFKAPVYDIFLWQPEQTKTGIEHKFYHMLGKQRARNIYEQH